MNIKIKLEINFYQKEETSFCMENTTPDKEIEYGEILLFSCFAIRTISNLGNQENASTLVSDLIQSHKSFKKFVLNSNSPDRIKIIQYKGLKGSKRFIIDLYSIGNNFNFTYNTKGFGLMGVGLEYYAPVATIALMKYLCEINNKDEKFVNAIEEAAEQCGRAWLDAIITLANHREIAKNIADVTYNTYEKK